MKTYAVEKKDSRSISRQWLLIFCATILVIGVFFRFLNIDKKVYWSDEVFTSLRVSGYSSSEMQEQLSNGSLLNIQDLHKYQFPNSQKSAIDTVKSIATEESQVAPLYFVLVRFWVEWFGDSITVTRSFSAFISLLTFPCLYWLCQELFASSLIAWIAIGLVAVSPVHVLYAQEARAYSLWIVTVLLSSIALLRAMRLNTKVAWSIYAATLPLGFYTHLFFSFVAFSQGIYVLIIERFRLAKTLRNYLVSLLIGFLVCVPWMVVIITNPSPSTVNWTNEKQTFFASSTRWAGIISRTFLDLGVDPNESAKLKIVLIPVVVIILSLIIYSIYALCRKTSKQIWLFVLTLAGSVILPLMVIDFVLQKRYGTTRYILPSILGIQLAVAYLFSTKISSIFKNFWRKKLWGILVCMVVISGFTSCLLSSQAQMWWNKVPEKHQHLIGISEIINQSSKPLVILDESRIVPMQSLSYLLEPKVNFQITPKSQIPNVISGFSDVFLYAPSDYLRDGIEKAYNSKFQQRSKLLWHFQDIKN